jgi:hypothetical protein
MQLPVKQVPFCSGTNMGGHGGGGGSHTDAHEPFVTARQTGEHAPDGSALQPSTQPGFAGQYASEQVAGWPAHSPFEMVPHAIG